jgi:hypothetical protein
MIKCIYGLVDPRTDEVFYVGLTTKSAQHRLNSHVRESLKADPKKRTYKQNKICAILSEDLTPSAVVLEESADWSIDDLKTAEKRWIKLLKSNGLSLCNLTDGGDGNQGWIPSPETIERLRVSVKNALSDPKVKKQMSESSRKRWDNEEERQKQSEAMKSSQAATEHRKQMHKDNTGRPLSEEHKSKIGKSTREALSDPDTYAKYRAAHLAATSSPEFKEKIKEAARRYHSNPDNAEEIKANKRRAAAVTNSRRVTCPVCNFSSTPGPLARHLKAQHPSYSRSQT